MTRVFLKDGIEWVGYVDWNVRDFHGYRTDRGSTYNAYLIHDEKPALIDTVKAPFAGELLKTLADRISLGDIRYVICNHAEPDHAGSLSKVIEACPNARLVCNEKCRDALGAHNDARDWPFQVVKDGDDLSLGKRTLVFMETPMVHWPESMFTYAIEDKLLFSMDAFGQHYASSRRFDDEEPLDIVMAEAKTYYANILMLYGKPIGRVMDRARKLETSMIAPSHGVVWRRNLGVILSAYRDWIVCKPRAKALVAYDTMWGSTERMANAILSGAQETGVEVRLMNTRSVHKTVVATETLDAAAMAFGSPTLNGTLMPDMAGTLTYLKGLRPAGKAGFAFGSYGWAKGGPSDVENYLKEMKFEILREPLTVNYAPKEEALEECRVAGRLLGEKAGRIAG